MHLPTNATTIEISDLTSANTDKANPSESAVREVLTWHYSEDHWQQFVQLTRWKRELPVGQAVKYGFVGGVALILFSLPICVLVGLLEGNLTEKISEFPMMAGVVGGGIWGIVILCSLSELVERRYQAAKLRKSKRIAVIGRDEVEFAGRTYRWEKLLWPKAVETLKTEFLEEEGLLILRFEWTTPKPNNPGHYTHELRIPVPPEEEFAARALYAEESQIH